MTKFSSTLVKRKGKGMKTVVPFEFEESASAIPTKIHMVPIGQWEHDLYGPMIINSSDIQEYVQNFNAKVRKGVFITAGHEGFQELPAVGWVTEVEARNDGLWGMVEWNKLGLETLNDKQFKFFSPEMFRDYEDPETHQFYRNVLTGGALTKSPYFKELEAIVFSEHGTKKKFTDNNNTMDLKTLLAKDISTLDEAEKAFIKEHAAELSDDEKKSHATVIADEANTETAEEKTAREEKEKGDANEAAGLNRDGSVKEATKTTEEIQASEKGMVQMTKQEFNMLTRKANEGAEAYKELEAKKLSDAVTAMVFTENNKEGTFLPKSKDNLLAFMGTLNQDQRTKFSALLKDIPKANVFGEIGDGGGQNKTDTTVQADVEAKVAEKMKADDKLKYADALRQVMSENKGLEEKYDKELKPVKGGKVTE